MTGGLSIGPLGDVQLKVVQGTSVTSAGWLKLDGSTLLGSPLTVTATGRLDAVNSRLGPLVSQGEVHFDTARATSVVNNGTSESVCLCLFSCCPSGRVRLSLKLALSCRWWFSLTRVRGCGLAQCSSTRARSRWTGPLSSWAGAISPC